MKFTHEYSTRDWALMDGFQGQRSKVKVMSRAIMAQACILTVRRQG